MLLRGLRALNLEGRSRLPAASRAFVDQEVALIGFCVCTFRF